MKHGLKNQSALIVIAVIIAALLFMIPVMQSIGKRADTEAAQTGKAYVEYENKKDPLAANNVINEAKKAVLLQSEPAAAEIPIAEGMTPEQIQTVEEQIQADTGAEAQPADPLQDPENAAKLAYLREQINTLNIIPLSDDEIAAYRQRLYDTVIVGDSMAQAVYEYGLLDADHVRYERGASIGNLGGKVQEALDMLPGKLVFFTGLNDTGYYQDAASYAEAYRNVCESVRSQRPDMPVYLCSMLPAADVLAAAREDLARAPEYDAALREMCAANGINYIDTYWMVRQELYLEDGIHFNYDFYQIWIQYIAISLGV